MKIFILALIFLSSKGEKFNFKLFLIKQEFKFSAYALKCYDCVSNAGELCDTGGKMEIKVSEKK